MMNKYKPTGWKYESTRHSLSSRGIKTGTKTASLGVSMGNKIDFSVKPNNLILHRIWQLPIHAVWEDDDGDIHHTHILDKKTPYSAKQRFFGIIKENPHLLGDIETKKPRDFMVSIVSPTRFHKEYNKELQKLSDDFREPAIELTKNKWFKENITPIGLVGFAKESDNLLMKGISLPTEEGSSKGYYGKGNVIVFTLDNPRMRIPEHKWTLDEKYDAGDTAFHELEHIRQFRTWEGKPKLMYKMMKGSYRTREAEQLARKYAKEKIKEPYLPSSTNKDNSVLVMNRVFGKLK